MLQSFTAVLDLFPSAEGLARQLGEDGNAVRKWRLRDSIPSNHWADVVRLAKAGGQPDVTMEVLQALRKAKADKVRKRRAAQKATPRNGKRAA